MRNAKVQQQSKIVTFPRKRCAGSSPRAYQALLDRCQLWDLVCMRTPQTEIAQIMGKDPAWVSRTIKEVQADFSTVHALPNENGIIRENLARWESLCSEALRIVSASAGFSRISAVRAAAEILRQKAEYQVTVGWVGNRRSDKDAAGRPTWGQLRDEISREDLESVIVTVADSIKDRKMKVADVKTIPALSFSACLTRFQLRNFANSFKNAGRADFDTGCKFSDLGAH